MNKDLRVVVVADFRQDRLQHEGVAVPLVQDDGPAAQLLRDASQWPVAHLVDLCCADKVSHCLRYTPVSTTALFRQSLHTTRHGVTNATCGHKAKDITPSIAWRIQGRIHYLRAQSQGHHTIDRLKGSTLLIAWWIQRQIRYLRAQSQGHHTIDHLEETETETLPAGTKLRTSRHRSPRRERRRKRTRSTIFVERTRKRHRQTDITG